MAYSKVLHLFGLLITGGFLLVPCTVIAQKKEAVLTLSPQKKDSTAIFSKKEETLPLAVADSISPIRALPDSSLSISDTITAIQSLSDSLAKTTPSIKLRKKIPDPKRALWLSLVIPGAGQIYNRKFWKLPIIYGGFVGCTYALLWNQQMYKDYSQAYIDIMDDDPNTKSYMNMLPYGYDITGKEEQFKNIFKHKKDFYRKNRDLSIFAFVGVYLLSVIDAYVDAQLSTFDITPDLSMKVEPTIIKQENAYNLRRSNAIGVQCSLTF